MTASTEIMTAAPHALAPHADEGARRGTDTTLVGVLLFITSEVMFFAGLFAAYFAAKVSHAGPWPPPGYHIEIEIAIALLAILLTSSLTMEMALRSIRKGNRAGMVRWTGATLALGSIFLVGQLYDYWLLDFGITGLDAGGEALDAVYGSVFYTLTGFHGAHVFGGVFAIGIMLLRGLGGQFSPRHHAAIEGVSWYWHFVDIVWIALVTTLYVLPLLGV